MLDKEDLKLSLGTCGVLGTAVGLLANSIKAGLYMGFGLFFALLLICYVTDYFNRDGGGS